MKKIILLFALVGIFSLVGCSGPEGPPGRPGEPGQNGLIGFVYENESPNFFNFIDSNGFKVRYVFPEKLVDSDVVLVYRLGGVDNGKAVWEFLPETYYFQNGIRDFSYNFNFTNSYVDIYLSGENLTTVPDENRLNQIFRIVVVPADFASSIDKKNIDSVISTLNRKEIKSK